MALLRRVEHPTPGNIEVTFSPSLSSGSFLSAAVVCLIVVFSRQAWEDTYAKWEQATKQILNFPKNKADDGQVGMLQIKVTHTGGAETIPPII